MKTALLSKFGLILNLSLSLMADRIRAAVTFLLQRARTVAIFAATAAGLSPLVVAPGCNPASQADVWSDQKNLDFEKAPNRDWAGSDPERLKTVGGVESSWQDKINTKAASIHGTTHPVN